MSILDVALRLINEHGEKITLKRQTGGEVDPISGKRTEPVVTTYYPYAVPEVDKLAFANAVNGTPTGEKVYMMDTTVEPKAGDKVTIGGDVLVVKSFDIQKFKGLPVYYTIRAVK